MEGGGEKFYLEILRIEVGLHSVFRKVFSDQSKLKKTLKVDALYLEILGIDVGPSRPFRGVLSHLSKYKKTSEDDAL